MAGRESRGTGGTGKLSKEEKEVKQRTIKDYGKKVTFKVAGDKEEKSDLERMKEEILEVINKEIEERKQDRKKSREDIEDIRRKMGEIEERIRIVEEELKELKNKVRDRALETETLGKGSEGQEKAENITDGRRSIYSYVSTRSVGNESRFSDREVVRLKRWVTEKDREERRKNIVIEGIKMPKELEGDKKSGEKWIEELIKIKLGVDMKTKGYRVSGTVVVVKLENEDNKKEIMSNKNKLKGERIFIENDLNWEERKIQEKMNRWVREKREKGFQVKIGLGRIRIGGIWRAWSDIEREEEKDRRKGKKRRKEKFWISQKGNEGKREEKKR